MTKGEFSILLNEIQEEEQKVRADGQAEYAHDDLNAFANFERLAGELGVSREIVLWVYLKKHLDGILSWIKGSRSQRESVQGRIKDARMYLALLWGMADDNNKKELNKRVVEIGVKHLGNIGLCEWPGCDRQGICQSGNFGNKLVCEAHFIITNGKNDLASPAICPRCGSAELNEYSTFRVVCLACLRTCDKRDAIVAGRIAGTDQSHTHR